MQFFDVGLIKIKSNIEQVYRIAWYLQGSGLDTNMPVF
ncbi:hypothetical protein PPEP_b0075 [Pseudoalteromonas peptidolytica F12-50-A1]|uniref:Uncharacterized protein n=1 Tax=Pseudoalteromonas peptidolytica F12-50-A1 TaxID=1315280 RepID=A0A8I0MZL0_9GAMM|nr:hypothetical protein [Pseudoalteromonas peptidolytica F12-50-A1]